MELVSELDVNFSENVEVFWTNVLTSDSVQDPLVVFCESSNEYSSFTNAVDIFTRWLSVWTCVSVSGVTLNRASDLEFEARRNNIHT